jgi:hypothetical protein
MGYAIRRTASLDTIYLKGQWPPEGLRMYCGHILVDKATQVNRVKLFIVYYICIL